MVRNRYSDDDILRLLREIELSLASGWDVATACRTAGVSDATHYTWRKRFGGMGRSEMANLKALQKENDRLKNIVAELVLDKLILKVSLDYLKPKALRQTSFVRQWCIPDKCWQHLNGARVGSWGWREARCNTGPRERTMGHCAWR